MVDRLTSLAKNLAQNLGALRAARGLTQAELARQAGVPRSTLTRLESGSGNPSLSNLARLADALQVTIEELLAPPRADCVLIPGGDLKVTRYSKGKVAITRLLPDPIEGLELERMDIEPGGWKQGIPHLSGTREYLVCAAGQVTVYVAGDNFQVQAGDVLAFPGDQAHSYRNESGEPTSCYSVVSIAPRRRRRGVDNKK